MYSKSSLSTIPAFLFLLAPVAMSQDNTQDRVSYAPALEVEDDSPEYRKFAPEFVDVLKKEITYYGREDDGHIVVSGDAKELEGLPRAGALTDEHSTELIVNHAPGQPPTAEQLLQAGFDLIAENKDGEFVVVRPVPAYRNLNRAAAAPGIQPVEFQSLSQIPGTKYIEPNVVLRIPVEELTPLEAEPEFTAQSLSELQKVPGVQRTGADAVPTFRSQNEIIVAVVDTGVEYTHSDLAANMWVNIREKNGRPGVDDDGNGVIDDIHGARFDRGGRSSGDPMDDQGHGTHCAGTVAAVANGSGVIGMTQAKIMALKFLNKKNSGGVNEAVHCIDYARLNGAKVISNSWGGQSKMPRSLQAAIDRARRAGILFIAAAGNNGQNLDVRDYAPANSNSDNVITVGAVNLSGQRSVFSNYGRRNVDIGAPGGDRGAPATKIYSTDLNNSFKYRAGTSMATPHVSGAAAMLWALPEYRNASYTTVRDKILNNARTSNLLSQYWSQGRELDLRFLQPGQPRRAANSDSGDETAEKEFYFPTPRTYAGDSTLIRRSITVTNRAIVNLFAGASAASASEKTETFITGISINRKLYQPSQRYVTSATNQYSAFGTTLTTTLEPGDYEVEWWVKTSEGGSIAVMGGGSLDVHGFKAE